MVPQPDASGRVSSLSRHISLDGAPCAGKPAPSRRGGEREPSSTPGPCREVQPSATELDRPAGAVDTRGAPPAPDPLAGRRSPPVAGRRREGTPCGRIGSGMRVQQHERGPPGDSCCACLSARELKVMALSAFSAASRPDTSPAAMPGRSTDRSRRSTRPATTRSPRVHDRRHRRTRCPTGTGQGMSAKRGRRSCSTPRSPRSSRSSSVLFATVAVPFLSPAGRAAAMRSFAARLSAGGFPGRSDRSAW